VHEEGLILALQEVQGQEKAHEELQVGGLGEGLVEVEVDQVAEGEEEESWDQEGSEVFDDEDGAPCDLGACSFERIDTLGWRFLKLRVAVFFFLVLFALFRGIGNLAKRVRTEILDMDDTRLLQTGILDSGVLRIGNHAAVTSLGDAQTVN
jgi:hypothetical protein